MKCQATKVTVQLTSFLISEDSSIAPIKIVETSNFPQKIKAILNEPIKWVHARLSFNFYLHTMYGAMQWNCMRILPLVTADANLMKLVRLEQQNGNIPRKDLLTRRIEKKNKQDIERHKQFFPVNANEVNRKELKPYNLQRVTAAIIRQPNKMLRFCDGMSMNW